MPENVPERHWLRPAIAVAGTVLAGAAFSLDVFGLTAPGIGIRQIAFCAPRATGAGGGSGRCAA